MTTCKYIDELHTRTGHARMHARAHTHTHTYRPSSVQLVTNEDLSKGKGGNKMSRVDQPAYLCGFARHLWPLMQPADKKKV